MRYQNELEVNSRRAGRGVLVGRVVRQPGGPHPVEYGQGPALTLWPLLRVPRVSAGPQSGMAWKIARSSPAEGGRTRAWCGTTERASMRKERACSDLGGRSSFQLGLWRVRCLGTMRCALGTPGLGVLRVGDFTRVLQQRGWGLSRVTALGRATEYLSSHGCGWQRYPIHQVMRVESGKGLGS